jgi:ketosteroid isomerase-like protein
MTGPAPAGALAVARGYHDAWQRRDYQDAWQLLSDDLTVDVPVNSYASKAAFAEAAQRTREMAAAVRPLAEFGNDTEAVLLYDLALPIGDLRIAEYFRVSGGRITRITHIHDTAALRAAGAGP